MKNQKGITLTSLIIYIVLIFVIIVVLARVSVYFTSNMSEISKESASIAEIDKFNMFFLKDTKQLNNDILNVSEDGISISFTNGAIYIFSKDKNAIYYENIVDNKKIIIAESIEECNFTTKKENSKDIVVVAITINEKKYTYEYVMRYNNEYITYETESNYISSNKTEGEKELYITTNTPGVIFTNSSGVALDDPSNLKSGDIVQYGDYKYTYNRTGWDVAVLDKTKIEYGQIATEIYGKKIINLSYTFANCTNLIVSPDIPEGVTNMTYTFDQCTSLTKAPLIPENVTDMGYTFRGCASIKDPPILPNGVVNMNYTFRNCISLKSAPDIPNTVKYLNVTFDGCTKITEAPVIPQRNNKFKLYIFRYINN